METCRLRQKFTPLVNLAVLYCAVRTHQELHPMTSLKNSNYLRSNRKRLALSQDEVAFLLGALSGTKVCRYERFVRTPSLETALA
jgi:hypothetical protein